MKINEQHNSEIGEHNLPQDVASQMEPINESRRRFTNSGLAVSGILLTVASRPSLGQTNGGGGVCKSPSGLMSGNLSFHGTPQTCIGRTPGYWGTHGGGGPQPNSWPAPYLPGNCQNKCTNSSNWSGGTKFKNVFNTSGNGSIYNGYTMMQVIWLGGGGDPYQLGAHIVSALLNARMGWTPVLTEAQVINMFNEWNQNGYFEPTAGVKWYAADIVAYLKTTMTL